MRTFRIQSRTPSVFCRAIFPLLLLLALVGCSTGSEGSRHAIYGSLDELVGDTTVIVVATASESQSRRLDGVQVNALTMHVTDNSSQRAWGQIRRTHLRKVSPGRRDPRSARLWTCGSLPVRQFHRSSSVRSIYSSCVRRKLRERQIMSSTSLVALPACIKTPATAASGDCRMAATRSPSS